MLIALIIALLFGGYAAPPEPAEGEQLPVPVLMYHRIDVHGGGRYNVSPVKFRKQLEELRRADYYLINISDLVEGRLDQVPAGKRPVVLTFDDSDDSHLRFLHNGRLDPNCAAGVLERFCEKHPDFGHGAAFFCLAGGERASFFNDYLRWEEKLVWLLDHGYEIGNHTTTHPDLSKLTPEEIVWGCWSRRSASERATSVGFAILTEQSPSRQSSTPPVIRGSWMDFVTRWTTPWQPGADSVPVRSCRSSAECAIGFPGLRFTKTGATAALMCAG
ncbi:polysaccharide deacetylase family protein [bacterium]|nr:polysaccharide deacetylase family protein [bacterium]